MWQADITHWELCGGEHAEILNMIDDHSRLFLASRAFQTVKASDVVDVFLGAAELHGLPACFLSDNGAVFSATPRKGKVLLQAELTALSPADLREGLCLHQTLKRYLDAQEPAETLKALQGQLDHFVHYYNNVRPHRALHGGAPLQAYSTRLKARPATAKPETHFRVRKDTVDAHGKVSLRYMSRLHHIGLDLSRCYQPLASA